VNKVLVFAPHFDDEAIGCGGTIARHMLKGDTVFVVFMTSGNSGSTYEPQVSQLEYSQLRRAEAAKALSELGITRPYECLELDEGFMRPTPELEKQLVTLIRRERPSIVYIPHMHDNHHDHKVTNLVVTRAMHRAQWTYYPHLGLEPHNVTQIRAYEVWTPLQNPNLYVNITDTVAIKEKAITCYQSQLKHCSFRTASLGLNQFRGLTGAGIAYAEAFYAEMQIRVE
jgi:LmbE family N-acetylglucosaminyl deacetylase